MKRIEHVELTHKVTGNRTSTRADGSALAVLIALGWAPTDSKSEGGNADADQPDDGEAAVDAPGDLDETPTTNDQDDNNVA